MKELILVAPTAKEVRRYQDWAPLFGFAKVSTLSQINQFSVQSRSRLANALFIHFPGSACLQTLERCPGYHELAASKHIAVMPTPSVIAELSLIGFGFRGVIPTAANRLAQAAMLEKVMAGELAFSNSALSKYILSLDKPQNSKNLQLLDSTTRKEKQVVELVCHGMSNEEIARSMSISINTVKMHLQNIYKKTNVKNRAQLLITFGT